MQAVLLLVSLWLHEKERKTSNLTIEAPYRGEKIEKNGNPIAASIRHRPIEVSFLPALPVMLRYFQP